MKKRRTVIKMADSEDLLASKGIGFEPTPRRPSLSSESSNYSPRPIVGVDRRPSLGDGSQNPNAGYPMQQRPDNDYYTRQNPPTTNNDPNSYYASGPSYGRGRKISNDSSYSDSFNPNQQQPHPRYPGGNQRTRQASVPLYNSANAEVQQPYFDQQRVRQASEGGYDNNRPAQYFSDSRFIAGQKGRKSSLEGLPSSLNSAGSSSGGSVSEYPERIAPSGRPRKTSADSNSRGNYSQNQQQQQQFYQNQPINPSYGDGASAYYNPDYVVRPRKNSLTELDSAAQFRARAGSVDRNLNASRYDADNRTGGNVYPRQQSIPSPPIGIGAARRPSQLAKAGLYQQPSFQRSRYPSNSGEDPFDRQINQQQQLQQQQQQMRASPPKPNIAGSRAGNLSHYSRQPIAEQSGETDYGFRGPQQYRGESRRPSQESPEKRRPSYEDNNSGGYMRGTSSGGPYRQSPDDRPIRSRTPTLDYRGGKAPQQNNTVPPDQYYNPAVPGRSKTPTKKVDDLGNYLQNVFFDKPRE